MGLGAALVQAGLQAGEVRVKVTSGKLEAGEVTLHCLEG
jgi:hypothetical protein